MRPGAIAAFAAGLLFAASTLHAAEKDRWHVPVAVKKLDNGLTVVVSEDHSSPTVGVSVVYHVGMRLEPRNRTGFAHLFEHLMFQPTVNRPTEYFTPLEAVGATDMNGSTTTDYTNYIQTVPTNALDRALWMEADRMGHLADGITQALLD